MAEEKTMIIQERGSVFFTDSRAAEYWAFQAKPVIMSGERPWNVYGRIKFPSLIFVFF
jgi:hypothetical protein